MSPFISSRLPFMLSAIALLGCGAQPALFTEDSKDRYVVIRQTASRAVISAPTKVPHRPDLKYHREIQGDLPFIFSEVNGRENPRLLVSTKNSASYNVVHQHGDRVALHVIAKALGMVVEKQVVKKEALTIRESRTGHKLVPSKKDREIQVEDISAEEDGTWPIDGASVDTLARFLETEYRRPVVNATKFPGRWDFLLSKNVTRSWPQKGEKLVIDGYGLEIQWEEIAFEVTVVRDK